MIAMHALPASGGLANVAVAATRPPVLPDDATDWRTATAPAWFTLVCVNAITNTTSESLVVVGIVTVTDPATVTSALRTYTRSALSGMALRVVADLTRL